MLKIDTNIKYHGPGAKIATLTGSPLWGKSIDQVTDYLIGQGFCHRGTERYPTPYGLGPLLQHFESPSGRSVIRIPSYGGIKGKDYFWIGSDAVFWLLWQAGVRVLIVGGTSGTADWRDPDDMATVIPGDFVLPWSFRTSERHRGLRRTPFETAWPENDLLMDDPFCTELSGLVAERVRERYSPEPFRSAHTPKDVRVALVLPDGITFETTYDILMWVAVNKSISAMQPELPPVITLHGDCVNPILARLLRMHMVYYHLPCNWAQGLHPEVGIVGTLRHLYVDVFPSAILELEAWMLDTLPIPNGNSCSCVECLNPRAPEVFSRAMTQERT